MFCLPKPYKSAPTLCTTTTNNALPQPSFPRNIFVELMQLATSCVEFSFNKNMYRQIDGVAMGSPLGPALANIFGGYQEEKLFNFANRPLAYFRYVDDTFAYSTMKMTAIQFSRISTPFMPPYASPMKNNSITPSPSWTCWKKDSARNFQYQSTGNLPSLASIYAGIPLAPTNGKSI